MVKFEKVTQYADSDIPYPVRKTSNSAGYDFVVAKDIVVPSYWNEMNNFANDVHGEYGNEMPDNFTLSETMALTKKTQHKPTLVPTGMKCYLEPEMYLELSMRSSLPLKTWLVLANGVGIIDADYADNPDNEGHIYFQLINLSPFDILLKKGDAIGQGIIKYYNVTDDDVPTVTKRVGGFGSTGG